MAGPPIVFILADQLRCDVLGAYGDGQCPTPRLDDLARQSTTFARHFTPCPQGQPARGSLMTGLAPRRHGAIINGWFRGEREYGTLNRGVALLPGRLVDAGYAVVHGGVQVLRAAPDLFTQLDRVEFIGPFAPGDYQRQLEQRGLYLGDTAAFRVPIVDYHRGKPVVHRATGTRTALFPLREDLFFDCVVAQKIAEAVRAHDHSRPLALLANFWLPHPPLWAPQAYANLIDPDDVQLKATVGRWSAGKPALQLANVPGQLGAGISNEQWLDAWAMYMGMAALLDKCVGDVFDALREARIWDDAIVIFTSTHCEMLGCHGLYQKMCLYEEAVRVPTFVKLPGQTQHRRVRELTDHLDLAATLIDFAEAEPLPGSPGMSLRRLAEGKAVAQPRTHVFAAYDGNAGRGFAQRMVRTKTNKFIHNVADHGELYDLIDDPDETVNLIGREETASTEQEMRNLLNDWMDETGDDQPRC